MKVALFSIAKDEDLYIEEWISYYKKLGVDDIWVSQHIPWKCKATGVNLISHDESLKQEQIFDKFLKEHSKRI